MSEIAIWVLAFLLAIAGACVAEAVWGGIRDRIRAALRWLIKWPGYFFYRSGLQGIARKYKILLASIAFLFLARILVWAAFALWSTDWGDDFNITAFCLGFIVFMAAIAAVAVGFTLFCSLFDDEDPYAAARAHAAQVFQQLSQPVHGRSGRASLADLRRAGL